MIIRIDSDFVYLPASCLARSTPVDDASADGDHSAGLLSSCLPRSKRRQAPTVGDDDNDDGVARLPLEQLIGADVDDRTGQPRIWFTEEQQQPRHTLRGYVCPPPLRVRVSAPIPQNENDPSTVVAALRAAARASSPPPSRFLAIINPASGQGKAMRDFERYARPVLERAAGIDMSGGIVLTRCAGHAREIAAREPLPLLSQPSAKGAQQQQQPPLSVVLAVVGGDGTLHEVINGLLSRPDWRECAASVALAHFPCGSGNGVAVSCGLRDAATAAVAVAKGALARMDVTSVLVRTAGGAPPTLVEARGRAGVLEDGSPVAAAAPASTTPRWTRTFCALSLVFGMMANLDVNTERLRWMGDARFTLGGALEILAARSYACKGAWVGGGEPDGDGQQKQGTLLASGRARSCDLLGAEAAATAEAAPQGGDRVLDDGGPPLPLLAQLVQQRPRASTTDGGAHPHLPDRIPDALPAGWRPLPLGGEGGGAHMWSAVGPTYVAGNYRFNPRGGLSTGALQQMWVPADAVRGVRGRLDSLALQDAAADGRHLDGGVGTAPLMRHAPAAALALEPIGAARGETYMQLDGEVVRGMSPAGGAVWAEVHKGLLRVCVAPGHPEAMAAV